MKIYITRKYKKANYTIGKLEINGEYFCDTLEPQDIGLKSTMLPEVIRSRKKYGKTAIPTGGYAIKMQYSSHFNGQRAFLQNVPGFLGVMIHEGNLPKHTKGCILVGRNTVVGGLEHSGETLNELNNRIFDCLRRKEAVTLEVQG